MSSESDAVNKKAPRYVLEMDQNGMPCNVIVDGVSLGDRAMKVSFVARPGQISILRIDLQLLPDDFQIQQVQP